MKQGNKKEKVPKVSSKPLKWYMKKKATCLHVLLHVNNSGKRSTFFKMMYYVGHGKERGFLFLGGATKAMQHLYTAKQAGEERLARIWMRLVSLILHVK